MPIDPTLYSALQNRLITDYETRVTLQTYISDIAGEKGKKKKMTGFSLDDFPEEILLVICDHMQPHAILSLSRTSEFWQTFCNTEVWPRRIATYLSVHAVHICPERNNSNHYETRTPSHNKEQNTKARNSLSHKLVSECCRPCSRARPPVRSCCACICGEPTHSRRWH